MFEGFRQCDKCRATRRNYYARNKDPINEKKKIERAKHTRLCQECNRKVRHENWAVHFHYLQHPNSELNNLEKILFETIQEKRKKGTLTDDIRKDLIDEYKRECHQIYKRYPKRNYPCLQ